MKTKNENEICFLGYKSKLLSLVVTLRGGDFGKKGTSRSCEHKTAGNHPPDVARERNTWPTIRKSILHFYQTQVQWSLVLIIGPGGLVSSKISNK